MLHACAHTHNYSKEWPLLLLCAQRCCNLHCCFWKSTHSQSFKRTHNWPTGSTFCFYCCCILPLYIVVTFHLYYVLTLQLALLLLLRRHCYGSTCTHTQGERGRNVLLRALLLKTHSHTHKGRGEECCYYWKDTTPHYCCCVTKTLQFTIGLTIL